MTNQNSTWSYVYDMIETTSLRELVHPHGLCLSLEKKKEKKKHASAPNQVHHWTRPPATDARMEKKKHWKQEAITSLVDTRLSLSASVFMDLTGRPVIK